jgi:purine nucleosidase
LEAPAGTPVRVAIVASQIQVGLIFTIMKVILLIVAFLAFTNAHAQTRVIADMDIDSDVDDVAALAMLNNMHIRGQIRLLGVVVTSDDPYAAVCTDAINRYFNKQGFPIGVLQNQDSLRNHSRYTRQISEEFPHKLQNSAEAESATALYRRLLSGSPDNSVIILTIGHLSNFQALLQSGADKYSRLSGIDLAEKKISKWFCMGGQFPAGREANFYRPDPASTIYCINAWKKPVIFAGWEVGEKIKTGGAYLKSIVDKKSPVAKAYELYNQFKGRSSWDQVAVYFLLKEHEQYFDIIKNGYCAILSDGSNEWRTDHESKHAYVTFRPGADPAQIANRMDNMVVK